MPLSRDEIMEYAARYISDSEQTDFVFNGDLFGFLVRELPENKVLKDDEGWKFAGYGICISYDLDLEAKPAGKWLWMKFYDLTKFPPQTEYLKLQPPHVVNGGFQHPARTMETKMIPVRAEIESPAPSKTTEVPDSAGADEKTGPEEDGKVLKFPKK